MNHNFTENIVRLSQNEIKELENNLKRPSGYYFFIAIIWGIGIFLMFVDTSYNLRIGFGIVILVILLVLVFNVNSQKRLILKDINSGKKKVWQGKVDDKRIETRGKKIINIIKINKEEFVISSDMWKEISNNSLIEIHFALNSKYVLRIKSMTDK